MEIAGKKLGRLRLVGDGVLAALCLIVAHRPLCAASRRSRSRDELRYACVVLEDAEDGKTGGWGLWDDDPPAEFRNAVDPDDARNRTIRLLGGADTGYEFRAEEPVEGKAVVQWRMRMDDERFYHYAECATSEGVIHLRYTPGNGPMVALGKEPVIQLPLEDVAERWVVVRRDLLADLRMLHPEIELLSIRALKFRGVGYIDDIRIYGYEDRDHDLLPDDFEKRRNLDPENPDDATPKLIAKVIELTDSTGGRSKDSVAPNAPKKGAKVRKPKRRRYRVALDASERQGLETYFEERLRKRLAQAPKPQMGRLYHVSLRAGGEIVGRLEKLADGRITLRTQHGTLVMPIHRVSRHDTVALFPHEAARQMAMRDVQKHVNRLIEAKIEAAEKAAAAAEKPVSALAGLEPAAAATADEGEDQAEPVESPPVLRVAARVGKPTYDVRRAPTPEEIKPALRAFAEWLKTQHRRVGGRIGTRLYAKKQSGNVVLYLVMDPTFLAQEYDLRHRMAVGIQQFWAFRCQGMGVADLSSAHLVMVSPKGRVVGGSRPDDPADVWVAE